MGIARQANGKNALPVAGQLFLGLVGLSGIGRKRAAFQRRKTYVPVPVAARRRHVVTVVTVVIVVIRRRMRPVVRGVPVVARVGRRMIVRISTSCVGMDDRRRGKHRRRQQPHCQQ
ncbi:MAG: hypothetical protein HQ567_31545 [Candidatus Nealsonbacteria bacterium]|nr:hypothetical protein [Candidatus Nealsonbacteria bacterium]